MALNKVLLDQIVKEALGQIRENKLIPTAAVNRALDFTRADRSYFGAAVDAVKKRMIKKEPHQEAHQEVVPKITTINPPIEINEKRRPLRPQNLDMFHNFPPEVYRG